jgi:hypothetical protein
MATDPEAVEEYRCSRSGEGLEAVEDRGLIQ